MLINGTCGCTESTEKLLYIYPGGGGGGTPGNSYPVSDQKMSHPFSDQTFSIHTRFQTWPLGKNYVKIT